MRQFFHYLRSIAVSSTARSTYVIFLGNGLSAVLAFIFTVSVARDLSLSEFGYFTAVLSFILLIVDIADIGVGSSLSRFLPTMEEKKSELYSFLKSAAALQVSIAIVLNIVIYILAPYITQLLFHSQEHTGLIQASSFGISSAILGNLFQYALSARQKFFSVSFLSVYGSAVRVVLFFVLYFSAAVTLVNVNAMQVFSFMVLGVTALGMLGTDFLKYKIKFSYITRLLSFTYHIAISRALTALAARLDVLMLISLTNADETGVYSIASRVITLFPLLAGSFSQVIAPKLASMKRKSDLKPFLINVSIGTFGIIFGIIVLIIIAEPFMTILFQEKGVPAVGVFRLLLISMIFFVASVPSVSTVIYYLKKPHVLAINSVLQVVIVAASNYILIPMYGGYGAALSSIFAFSTTLFLTMYMCYYYLQKHDDS